MEEDDVPPCKSCGVPWGEHLGIQGTCAMMQAIAVQLKTLRKLAAMDGLKAEELLPLIDAILGLTKI